MELSLLLPFDGSLFPGQLPLFRWCGCIFSDNQCYRVLLAGNHRMEFEIVWATDNIMKSTGADRRWQLRGAEQSVQIKRAFQAIGINTKDVHRTNNNYDDDRVAIWIGLKPSSS
jgi:hypothetical protein